MLRRKKNFWYRDWSNQFLFISLEVKKRRKEKRTISAILWLVVRSKCIYTLVMLHRTIDFSLSSQTFIRMCCIGSDMNFLKQSLNMIASYLICYQNTKPSLSRELDICLDIHGYPCCLILRPKQYSILFMCCIQTKPTWLIL